jgi:hypothetical protein
VVTQLLESVGLSPNLKLLLKMELPKYFSFGCIMESELLEDSPIFLGCVNLGKGDNTEASAKIKVLENSLKGAIEGEEIASAKMKAVENKLKGAIEDAVQ